MFYAQGLHDFCIPGALWVLLGRITPPGSVMYLHQLPSKPNGPQSAIIPTFTIRYFDVNDSAGGLKGYTYY